MARKIYEFTITLEVASVATLKAAAKENALSDGIAVADFLKWCRDGGTVNTALVQLLDPGSIPGCKVHDSGARMLNEYDGI